VRVARVIGDPTRSTRKAMTSRERRRVKKRLEGARLGFYCREPAANWPSPSFLKSLEADVGTLSATKRVSWKTFQRLDKRLPSLRLALCFSNLVNHAVVCLDKAPPAIVEHARPLVRWLVKINHPRVRELETANRAVAFEVAKQMRSDKDAGREKERERARVRKERERRKKNFDKKP
jgi:hypothetical protein